MMKVWHNSKLVGEFKDDATLLKFMEKDGYWPNLFFISDHGNVHHYHLDGVKYGCSRKGPDGRYGFGCQLPTEQDPFDPESDYVIEDNGDFNEGL